METLSVRDYRNNLAASFAKADGGENVLIRRKGRIYALISVGREDLMVTPELQARIEAAEVACRDGRCVTCRTAKEIEDYLDSL